MLGTERKNETSRKLDVILSQREENMSEDKNKVNQESEGKSEASKPAEQGTDEQSSLPLYLRNKSDGDRGNAQDEKDESNE
jgi:hypothetical protein